MTTNRRRSFRRVPRWNRPNGGSVLGDQHENPELAASPVPSRDATKQINNEHEDCQKPEEDKARRGIVRPACCGDHHVEAHGSPNYRRNHRLCPVEAVKRSNEPEQPRDCELALTGKPAQLNDRGTEECPADPVIYFRVRHQLK